MWIKITDIILDKKSYLYWIDKNINISFKLKSDNNEHQKVKEIYIYYWFNVFWKEDKHFIYSNKIVLDNQTTVNNEINYSTSIPIVIPNIKASSTKIENFIYIQINNLNIKEELKTKIYFSVKKYEKNWIKNIINYGWISNYIMSKQFENESESDIEKKMNELSNIDDNYNKLSNYNKIALKTKFKWFSFLFFNSDNFLKQEDYIDKEILNNILQKSLFAKISHYLLNSPIYWIIYKYFFIPPVVFFLLIFIFPLNNIIWMWLWISFILSLFIFIFSKLIEKIYKKFILKNMYDIKLHSSKTISNNINNKLKTWKLDISDIFSKFEIINTNNPIDYILSIRLDTYLQSYEWTWKYVTQLKDNLHWIELFNSSWKKIFNINDIKILENDYSKIFEILVPIFQCWWVNWVSKIYYKLVINFESSYLPNYKKELNINIDKKLIFSSNNNINIKKWLTILIIILFFSLPLLEKENINEIIQVIKFIFN